MCNSTLNIFFFWCEESGSSILEEEGKKLLKNSILGEEGEKVAVKFNFQGLVGFAEEGVCRH